MADSDSDAQLQIKKRARRRLVGALFFVSVVAVVLPMVMDSEPKAPVQDVEIRIPGQDEKPFAPRFATVLAEKPPARPTAAEPAVAKVPAKTEAPAGKRADKTDSRPAEPAVEGRAEAPARPGEKLPEKSQEKIQEKLQEKPQEKPPEKTKGEEARRVQAILAGEMAVPQPRSGEHLILIGAFASEANVKSLRSKLGEQGVKTFTEPLESPQGRKTRVRAGPFPSREAAETALEKMKRIGVSGVVVAR